MVRLSLVTVTLLALATISHPADAISLYSTGFESPAFQAGQPLAGQDGWVNQIFNGNPLGPNGAISTAHPNTGLQSVRVNGADLTGTSIGYDVGSYRQFVNFDVAAAGYPVVRVEADVRIDGPLTPQTADRATGDFFSANLVGFSADGDLGEMSLSSDGHVYSYSATNGYIFEQPINLGQYYRLGLDYNFTANTTTYRFNGQVLGTQPFDATFTSDVMSRGSIVLYAIDSDSLNRDRSAYSAYYDNFSVTTVSVPEPASLALVALVIPLAANVRRRFVG